MKELQTVRSEIVREEAKMPRHASNNLRWTATSCILLGVVIAVVYGRCLHDPFIFDDVTTVTNNPSIIRLWPLLGDAQQPGPLNPPRDLPTSGRPLVNLTVALNYYFGEFDPVGYHAFDLVLHWLAALLLLAIARRTLELAHFGDRFQGATALLALAVALLWTVHPLQTETVVYVTQRTELMVGVFYLATLYASLRYWAATSPAGRRTWLVLAALACLCGMASKEVMVTAPVIVLLFERTFVSGSFRSALRQSWPLYAGLALGWGLLAGLNYQAPRSATAGFHLDVAAHAYWLTQTKVLLMYLKLVACPWPLIIHYESPYLNSLAEAWPWVLPVIVLGLATIVLLWRRSAAGFIGACVFIILSPTVVVPIITEVAAERRMYLPLAAILAGAVAGGYALAQRLATGRDKAAGGNINQSQLLKGTATVVGIVAIILSLVSVHRLAAYETEVSIWQDTTLHQPNDALAHNNLGAALMRVNRYDSAKEELETALQISPGWAVALKNLADALASLGQYQEAVERYRQLLGVTPSDYKAWNSYGGALVRIGKPADAIDAYEEAIRQKPDYADSYYNLGSMLSQTGRFDKAIENYKKALQLQPSSADTHYNLGFALVNIGRRPEAVAEWEQTLLLDPNYTEAHNNLGHAFSDAGQLEEALQHYQQALQLDPTYAAVYANMADTLAKMHRREEAIAAAQKAIELATAQRQTAKAEEVKVWLANYRAEQNKGKPDVTPAGAGHAGSKP